jgi:hypothetical protein
MHFGGIQRYGKWQVTFTFEVQEATTRYCIAAPLPLELDSIILARSGKPISLDSENGFRLLKVSSFPTK